MRNCVIGSMLALLLVGCEPERYVPEAGEPCAEGYREVRTDAGAGCLVEGSCRAMDDAGHVLCVN